MSVLNGGMRFGLSCRVNGLARLLMLNINIPSAKRVIGDPIAIYENDAPIEAAEFLYKSGKAFIIDLPNYTTLSIAHLLDAHTRPASPRDDEYAGDLADRKVLLGPHRWNFNKLKLKTSVRKNLNNTRKIALAPDISLINSIMDDRSFGGLFINA